jgi:lysozyme family protein
LKFEFVMNNTFEDKIRKTLQHEGGYVNDPHDPGGETKFGISQKAYPTLNIKELTEFEAISIYKDDYWDKNKVDKLPDLLKGIYFDMCVNMGAYAAGKIIQRAANGKNGKKASIKVDGNVGPNTLKAIKKLSPDRLRSERILHYARIIVKNPKKFHRYWFGWYKRALDV